ncbi:MAG: hypothetical protein HYZ27_10415 [Deltaproteobacteria bacterium]|nr:hypothetical protein [Deltaproteobacteria bacterium]
MRRAAGLVLGALALLVLSHVLVEALHLRFAQPAADESIRSLEVFRTAFGRVDVALLGSSQIRRGVSASLLARELSAARGQDTRVFNLGLQAGTLPAYTIVARDLLVGEQMPAVIVLGLGARCANSNNPRHSRVVRHLMAPRDWLGPMGARLSRPAELAALPVAAFRAPATLLLAWRSEDHDFAAGVLARQGSFHAEDGESAGPDPTALSARTAARAKENRDDLLVDFAAHGRAEFALEELFRLGRERGIALLVANLPVSAEFAAQAYTRGEDAAYLAMLRETCARNHARWVDLNAATWGMESFDDGDHLSAAGARRCTEMLAPEILDVWRASPE